MRLEKLKLIKPNMYNWIRCCKIKLDEHTTLAVKHQPIESVKPKTKMNMGFTQITYSLIL